MPTYSYCSLTLVSNILIDELYPLHVVDEGQLLFNLNHPDQQPMGLLWSHEWLSSANETFLAYCRQDSDHWLRFPGLADFRISANVEEISCVPLPEIPEKTIRHLLLDQVLPRCLAHHGRVMLHASAVHYHNGLLLFIGDSGAGKSTLAADFHRSGQPAVSDDCLWIKEGEDEIEAIPSYGGLRLWEDSLQFLFSAGEKTTGMAHYSSKKRVPLEENAMPGSEHGMPVLAVIVLSPAVDSLEVNLEKLPHRETFIAMLKQTFQLDPTDLERMTRHAQALGRIVPKLKSFRLSMPHDYALLPLARQKILEAVV